jgi:branched-chain amino acid transport system permease protein
MAIVLGAALLVSLPVVAGLADEPYLVTLFSRILIYALAAVSLDLMLGFGGMVSLGHAAFLASAPIRSASCPCMVSRAHRF